VLHHPRRHAPEEKPGNSAQPFSPHHNQIGMVFGGQLHDLFSRLPKLAHSLRRKSRLGQLPHAPFDLCREISSWISPQGCAGEAVGRVEYPGFCLCLGAVKIRTICYTCLSKGTETSAQKGVWRCGFVLDPGS
jgi:hypothetical protein